MDTYRPMEVFFDAVRNDGRICITHIGLFATLLRIWQLRGFPAVIQAYSYEIMEVARISSRSTYHQCIRDLHDFGYIKYYPSFNKNRRSSISLLNDEMQ